MRQSGERSSGSGGAAAATTETSRTVDDVNTLLVSWCVSLWAAAHKAGAVSGDAFTAGRPLANSVRHADASIVVRVWESEGRGETATVT